MSVCLYLNKFEILFSLYYKKKWTWVLISRKDRVGLGKSYLAEWYK